MNYILVTISILALIIILFWIKKKRKEKKAQDGRSKKFGDDFQFLLVDVNEKRDKVKKHVDDKGITLQVVLDKYGKAFEKFGGETLPLLVVIDKNGKITYYHRGYMKGDEIKLKEHLKTNPYNYTLDSSRNKTPTN